MTSSDGAAVAGVLLAAAAVVLDERALAGAAAVAVLAVLQAVAVRRPPVPATVLGVGQLVAGLVVVAVAAVGMAAG